MPQLIATVEGVEIKHVFLHKDRTTLGRKPGNDIIQHCAFELQGRADVFIEDLGSTNGTFVNNHKIKRQQLHDGDLIAIGSFRIQYLAASEEPSGFGETTAFRQDSDNAPLTTAAAPLHASFQVLSGTSAGLEVPVLKAVTTFGKPGVAVVAVSHRRTGFFVACMDGTQRPTLNGQAISDDPMQLADNDVMELAGTRMQFRLQV